MKASTVIQNHIKTEEYNFNGVSAMALADSRQVETYENFLKFYDIAEKFIDKLESLGDEAEEHIEAVENLVLAVEENTEIIVEYYVKHVKSGNVLKGLELQKIEFAMKRIKEALAKFKKIQEDMGYTFDYSI